MHVFQFTLYMFLLMFYMFLFRLYLSLFMFMYMLYLGFCLDCTCVVPREWLGLRNIRRFKRRIYPALLYSSVRISGNTWNVVLLFLCMCRLRFMVFLKDNIQITLFCRHYVSFFVGNPVNTIYLLSSKNILN